MSIVEKRKYIVSTTLIVVVVAIIASQVYWVINMYNSYEKEVLIDANKYLEKSVYMEVTERSEGIGGFLAYPLYTENGDTSKYIEKTITREDTTFNVTIDRQDPNANLKIIQFALKDIVPIDVSRLNELFQQEMHSSRFSIQDTYVEYYDLTQNTIAESSGDRHQFASYISSDMITMDIMDSMGVIGYVNNPVLTILGGMIIHLVLSVILIIIAIIGLIYLGRMIFRQWKEEKMRQDSVNTMTHEFRRPISAAVTLVSLIPHYIERDNVSKASLYAELTIEELDKLTKYTKRIQQISNNDKSTITLNKSEIDIPVFLESLIEKYCSSGENVPAPIDDKPVKINLNISPECSVICVDRVHFANVIDNLIENAIKYSGDDTLIDISACCQNGRLRVSVKDNGIGLSKTDLKYVFEKFYRVDSRFVRRKAGFGLGLTYVKSIVEEHGGSVEVSSEGRGHGCEFVLYMPVDNNDIA